ncbi:MAG: hypothetical protein H6684_00195 [Deltaproteobacteria bacterium]|nr:hypothetical protein [bacterium]MCB9475992.1 hypothetical protein [Deltaproteobacteria bacterium]MCB9480070.1 hypothetical protein [Deltaproteobacteria bacterium]MCB9487128.1 hypothetical protein [Deltaproteobacteria bacterium]
MRNSKWMLMVMVAMLAMVMASAVACGDDDDDDDDDDDSTATNEEKCLEYSAALFGSDEGCYEDEVYLADVDGECAILEDRDETEQEDFLSCMSDLADTCDDFDDADTLFSNGVADCYALFTGAGADDDDDDDDDDAEA